LDFGEPCSELIEGGGLDGVGGEGFGGIVLTVGGYFELLDLAGGGDHYVHAERSFWVEGGMGRVMERELGKRGKRKRGAWKSSFVMETMA